MSGICILNNRGLFMCMRVNASPLQQERFRMEWKSYRLSGSPTQQDRTVAIRVRFCSRVCTADAIKHTFKIMWVAYDQVRSLKTRNSVYEK